MRRLFLLFVFACFFWEVGTAQRFRFVPEKFSEQTLSDVIANTSLPSSYNDTLPVAVYDQWSDYVSYKSGYVPNPGSNGYYQGSYQFKSIQDLIKIGIRHTSNLHVPAFKYKVSLSILKYDYLNPNVPTAVVPITLTVSYDPDSLKQYQDLTVYKFSDCLKFQVVINGIYDLNTSGLPTVSRANLAKNFYIESEVVPQRYVEYPVLPVPECSTINNTLRVFWESTPFGSFVCKLSALPLWNRIEANTVNYELEWTYIDDYQTNLSTTPPTNSYKFNSSSTIPYDFRHNSTRIQTNNLSYEIPLVYEHGAIVYRVRALTPRRDSNYKDQFNHDWSLPDYGTVDAGSSCFPGQGYLITNAHSGDSLNWQYSIQFAEQGKYKHVINYFDGALKDRQTQTKINSNSNYVVVAEKAYDYEGRPVLQTLPTPVPQNALGYRNDIALNSATGKPYSPAELDKPGCSLPDSLAPMSGSAMAHKYYSVLNTDTSGIQEFVPDAQGYPFVQSIYSPDNTNKIVWQGGAGKDFQPWKGHATQHEYVRALQPELDGLLGTEAGYAAFYPKQVTTDPNGQSSFSIFNPAGKVVVSGLLGLPDTAGRPIDLLPEYTNGNTICTDLLRGSKQSKDFGRLSVSVPYYSDKPGNPTKLTYSASIPAFPIGCSKYLWTKGYYAIRISDDCGVPVAYKEDTLGRDSVLSSNTALSVHGDSINATLDKGRYTVSKELRLSPFDIGNQVREFVSDNEPSCFYNEKHFVRGAVEAADFPCTNTPNMDPCGQKRLAMMKELYPGAKYGEYIKNRDSSFFFGQANSIFTPRPLSDTNFSVAYQTAVDDNNHPLGYGEEDRHWLMSYDKINWFYPRTYINGRKPYADASFGTSGGNNLQTHWISGDSSYYALGYRSIHPDIYFKTYVLLDSAKVNTFYWAVAGWFGLNIDSINHFCNGQSAGYPYGNNWGHFFHPANLHAGINELVFRSCIHYNNPYVPVIDTYRVAIGSMFSGVDTEFKYRYQNPCLSLPDTTWTNGVMYTNLASLSPDEFIKAFNDTIAAALLPLHPEYCKLALCSEGDFTDQLEAVDFKQADAINRFKLDSIIAHDPLYTNADVGAKAQMRYDLSHIKNYRRMDSLAIEMAYCAGGNNDEAQHCISYLYPSEIAAISFTNDGVKENYYNTLKQLYLANRGLILQQIRDGANDTCPTCASARMELVSNPVFPKLFSASGTIDTSLHLPGWLETIFNGAMNNDTAGASAAVANIQGSLNDFNATLCQGQIDAVIRGLANCTLDTASFPAVSSSTHKLALVRYFLNNRCGTGAGQDFTPNTVDSALAYASLSKTDLCHPFLVAYGVASAQPDESVFAYRCGDTAVYDGLKSFLNRSEVKTAILNATAFSGSTPASGYTLNSSNEYESRMALLIGGTSFSLTSYKQTVPASTSGAPEYVKITVAGSSGSVSLYMRSKDPASTVQLNGQTVSSFTSAGCIANDINAVAQGAIAQNTALVRANIGGSEYDFFVWTKEISVMVSSDPSALAGAVTCMDLKRGMEMFYADSTPYKYDVNINHPLFSSTLTNYLNFKFGKRFTYNDYKGLMEGCAITDQLVVKKYQAGYTVTFGSYGQAKTFVEALKTVGGVMVPDCMLLSLGSDYNVWLDVSGVAKHELLKYKSFIDSYSTGVTSRQYLWNYYSGAELLFTQHLTCPSLSISSTYGTLGNLGSCTLEVEGNVDTFDFNVFTPSATAPLDYANNIAAVKTAIAAQCPSTLYLGTRELLRSADYTSTPKQQYLSYVYSQGAHNHDAIIADIAPGILTGYLSAFSGKTVSYNDPLCVNKKRDLYLFNPSQGSHPGFTRASSILSTPSTLFPVATSTVVNSSLSVYKKGNGIYWYRYFDASNNLYNIYLVPPAHSMLPLDQYDLSYIRVAGGDDSSRFLTAYIYDPAAPTVLIPCKGYADFTVGYSQKVSNVLLLDRGGEDICIDTNDCEHGLLEIAKVNGRQAYNQYNDSTIQTLTDSMIRFVINHTVDTLELCSGSQKYHYTLYYYDRSGNLIRTVPPAGVQAATASLNTVSADREDTNPAINGNTLTQHKKVSIYRYNAENKLTYQKTPDGGSTFMFYDGLGNLSFSQTTRQREFGNYTYILYDGQQRPIETGQVQLGCTQANAANKDLDTARCIFPAKHGFASHFGLHPPYMEQSSHFSIYQDSMLSIIRSLSRTDVVVTTYDTARRMLDTIAFQNLSRQENLLHRVSTIEYFPAINPNFPNASAGGTPKFTTYYSYDIDGNVSTVSYDFVPLATLGQRYKRVDYDYDLVSGKVNAVSVNRGRPDQFYQRYEYDADNRITEASSSGDGIIWNKDARYNYYLHGPLAQVQLGDAQIQSLEYAYTINGWLKAINGDVLRPDLEMGRNGTAGDLTYPRDIIAHALTYYDGDYRSVSQIPVIQLAGPAKGLYNGNIAQQTTGMVNVGTMQRNYRYDQLQRLKLTGNASVDDNTLTVSSPSNMYKSTYAYDPDGNIKNLSRWDGGGVKFDNFAYNYDGSGNDNKLLSVTDSITTNFATYTDIKSGQAADNYSYDLAGNLVKDKQGNLHEIKWNLAGKVSSITDSIANKHIFYDYDGAGNRIYKEVVTDLGDPGENHQGEYYLRDASGNILATYKTSKVYKGTILALNKSMSAGDMTGYEQFLNGDVSQIFGFKSTMINEAITNYPNWVDSVLGVRRPSYYFGLNSSLEGAALNSTTSWIDSLKDYETANSLNIYGSALHLAQQANDPRVANWLGYYTSAPATLTELTALMTDFATYMAPVANMFWMGYSGPPSFVPSWTGSPATDGANFANAIYPAPPTLVNDIMMTLNGNPTLASNFWTGVVADNTLWNSSNVRGGSGMWENDLAAITSDYGNATDLGGFYDNYWVGAEIWVNSNISVYQRLESAYDDPGMGLVAAFSQRIGDSLFANVINSVSGMNVPYYQSIISGSPSGIVVYTGPADTIGLTEHHIYGSSRLGMQTYSWGGPLKTVWRENFGIVDSTLSNKMVWYSEAYGDLIDSTQREPWGHGDVSNGWEVNRTVGLKYYELSDHLGNVLATVLDRKTGILASGSSTLYDRWKADVATVTDYYPFGMEMPGRSFQASSGLTGRFGFNGQMKDNEVAGTGNSLDFGARQHDSRIARLNWSVDPLADKFPSQSPYLFANNNPNLFVDKEGKHGVTFTEITDKHGNTTMIVVVNKFDYFVQQGPSGTIGWDRSFDYIRFASINLQTGKVKVGSPIQTNYVPGYEKLWRRLEEAVGTLDKMSKPGPLKEAFTKYYTPGSGGIMFQMTNGQGQENRKAQFPDGNIVNVDDILKFTGNYGGSGGIGLFANWADKLANFNAAADMTDYMGGVDNRQFSNALNRAEGANGGQMDSCTFCAEKAPKGQMGVGHSGPIVPAKNNSTEDN